MMTMRATVWVGLVAAGVWAGGARGDVPEGLRAGHPRLIVLDKDIEGVRRAIGTDATAKRWHGQLVEEAERLLKTEPVEHVLIGPRLLDKSRPCLTRVSTLAGLYRLDKDERFARRAIREMLAVSAFADWNPKHFLDTAEMTCALGIGYDWLYDVLSAEERGTIREAIVRLGLKEGLKIYEKQNWWTVAKHNWNQVCNGGMTVGALAVADEEPEVAGRVIEYARKSIPKAMASFAPDGGWNEGPGYWSYTTLYTFFYLASLETGAGTDFGISKSPGYADTGYFRMHFTSPIGKTFNYADAGDSAGSAFQMMWMGRALERPLYAAHVRVRTERPGIFHLLFFDVGGPVWPAEGFATSAVYRGVDVAFFRSSWTVPNAAWVGFKGGDNKANHSHLDLGTFNFDALGQRWAMDFGGDNYNLPGYFGKQRWTYYRLRTEAHNTLTIDDENQEAAAKAPLVAYKGEGARAFAVADLTKAFGKMLSSWRRGVALGGGRALEVVDEVAARGEAVKVTWNFHTPAKVEVAGDGRSAVLTGAKGARVWATIASPAEGRFEVVSANPPPPQRQNPGVSNLTVALPGKVRAARIVVRVGPVEEGVGNRDEAGKLEGWIAEGRLPAR
jgi:hypothetical protein